MQRHNAFTSTIGERPIFAPSPEGDWVKWEEASGLIAELISIADRYKLWRYHHSHTEGMALNREPFDDRCELCKAFDALKKRIKRS